MESLNRMERTAALERLSKTILLVDDDNSILDLVSIFLGDQYNILLASGGTEAVQRSEAFKGKIHLLLTDCHMPGLKGKDLAAQIALQRPEIKVLLMSGLGEDGLGLRDGWRFLAKPFDVLQVNKLIADIFAAP
jgi:two-component system, cell cycle sensor histidine kinase and response regulator CckA